MAEHKIAEVQSYDGMDKRQFYASVVSQAKGVLEGERDLIANTANISSLLFYELNRRTPNLINWAGFYFVKEGELVLGPFQGEDSLITHWRQNSLYSNQNWQRCLRNCRGDSTNTSTSFWTLYNPQIVPDVHKFPGHIACDSASNSEIVVPLKITRDGKETIQGVLDIDSAQFNSFDEIDKEYLQQIAEMGKQNSFCHSFKSLSVAIGVD